MLQELLVIGIGGAIGAIGRYGLVHLSNLWFGTHFPWGTLLVNVLGSLLIGILFVLLIERSVLGPLWRSFAIIGLLGAFTTFSTFSLQTLALFEEGRLLAALGYVGSSVVICVLATALGMFLTRQLP